MITSKLTEQKEEVFSEELIGLTPREVSLGLLCG